MGPGTRYVFLCSFVCFTSLANSLESAFSIQPFYVLVGFQRRTIMFKSVRYIVYRLLFISLADESKLG